MDLRHSFLLLDALEFDALVAALGLAWRQRSFRPCHDLFRTLTPRARAFAVRARLNEEPLLCRIPAGLRFDRDIWRYLVGEALWICAVEIPHLETCPRTLTCLLAPEWLDRPSAERSQLPPILQVHCGRRELLLGGRPYLPEQVGWNDPADAVRLRDYLEGIDPGTWTEGELVPLRDLPEYEEEEELGFARDWFEPLRAVYRHAAERGWVVVCEVM